MMWSEDQKYAAKCMLEELSSNKLTVCKLDGEPRSIRVAVQTNPEWYSGFCSQYMSRRKRYPRLRTFIKRVHTANALKSIINGVVPKSVYMERLEPFVDEYLEGLIEQGYGKDAAYDLDCDF